MNNFDPTDIESAVTALVKGMFPSVAVYNNRPKSAVSVNDFIVVRLASEVVDRDAFGECRLEISLFARDVECFKNTKRLGYLYDTLVAGLPAASGRYLIGVNPTVSVDVPDDFGFHARIMVFKLTTKKQ